jgi:choline dehydrogenase-like flavoprotein
MDGKFDAIVVGSGITGGWAAKELTEKGLKVLLVERGPMLEHQTGYKTELMAPWQLQFRGYGDRELFARDYAVQSKGMYFNEWTHTRFVNDRENPYETTTDQPFQWRRGYQLGGKSLLWGRQCYRWSDLDFSANAADGHGVDWPIRYADVAPWYDHRGLHRRVGIAGPSAPAAGRPVPEADGDGHCRAGDQARARGRCPDRKLIIGRSSNLTEPWPGRSPCQYRNICARGCSFGAYFSTLSSTLPAAHRRAHLRE